MGAFKTFSSSCNFAARFFHHAKTDPSMAALRIEEEVFSYGDLLEEAQRLAALLEHHLPSSQEEEAGDAPVIAASRFLPALGNREFGQYLASLTAPLSGRVFVPLFSGDPLRRHRDVLQKTGARVLVVDDSAFPLLEEICQISPHPLIIIALSHKVKRVFVPAPHIALGRADLEQMGSDTFFNAPFQTQGDDFAYLLFTSGSTGAPKGIATTHANVRSFIEAALFRLTPFRQDRFAQISHLTWDQSVVETQLAWAAGACVCRIPDKLAQIIPSLKAQEITFWSSTPSLAHALSDRRLLAPYALEHLRTSVFCGEALSDSLAEQWQEAAPSGIIENFYGPTEATVWIAGYRWRKGASERRFAPFGEAFPGQRLEVRNEKGEPLALGEVGELYLSGSQVVPGYWQNPEQTQQRFLRDAEGVVWYRTGDMAQYTPEGWIFRGRTDDQIKIYGYRVERQEVEALLREAAGSQEVAVIALPMRHADHVMALYGVVAHSEKTSTDILEQCRRLMPKYMVPITIHFHSLPKTSSGKVDYPLLKEYLIKKSTGLQEGGV